jgi:2'-5' RNA ligase
MQTLVTAYRHLHKATQKLVNHYSPHITLNHLTIKNDATESEIVKNMDELRKYYTAPHLSYLHDFKKSK